MTDPQQPGWGGDPGVYPGGQPQQPSGDPSSYPPQYAAQPYGQQYGQPQYGQPQYGQYGQPQYAQPTTHYGQPGYGQPGYGQDPAQPGAPQWAQQSISGYVPPKGQSGMAIAGLVLGILCLVFCWFPFVGTILAVLAVVFAGVALRRKDAGHGQALAGAICGGIGFVLSVFLLILELSSS